MINERSLQVISEGRLPSGFLKPQYATYCFSQIPSTILSLLGCGGSGLPRDCFRSGTYERVILLLIDGFGWKFLEKYKDRYPFLKQFYDKGIVSKLTAQFPSTTAVHITTLCSTQPVGQHGIYEWFMYEPKLGRVVAPLLYSYAGDKKVGTLDGILKPADFFPEGHLFKELQKHKIPCKVFQQETIARSIYSNWMFDGADRVSYKDWPQGIRLLQQHISSPGLFYLYFGDFDTQAHHHGVTSAEVEKALDLCFHELDKLSYPSSTALLVTADHGMIDIHPSTTIYVNQKFPNLESKLKRGVDGHVLAPAGSCRDFFLHVEPRYVREVLAELKEGLGDIAWVCLTSELIKDGFFGSVSQRLTDRMADIAIITKGSHSIWWYEEGRFEQKLFAMHGGLTPNELETIFLFRNL